VSAPSRRTGFLVAAWLAMAVVAGCSRSDFISRDEWQRMAREDRVVYVSALLGAEKAKDAKGGGGRKFDRPAEEYVTVIDQAYERGDTREPHQILWELGR
jgi:hypothetical protein